MKLITESMETFLQEVHIPVRLACVTESGWPMVLSLWYLYEKGSLYCATPKSAQVVKWLRKQPRCGFEIASDLPPYCGIRGRAIARLDEERGEEVLERLLHRYLGGTENPLAAKLLSRRDSEMAVEIVPERIFAWNFSRRMKSSVGEQPEKRCPEGQGVRQPS